MSKAGVIGWPIDHSVSPALHRYWLKCYGLEGSYDAVEVAPQEIKDIKKILQRKDLCGVNVTIPHKEAVIPYLDGLDEAAKAIGAVNTIVNENGKWIGKNTDVVGFSKHLLQIFPEIRKQRALILGAGGAARAVVKALQDNGFKAIILCNRTHTSSQKIADEFLVESISWDMREQSLGDIDLLINTTSLGMIGKDELVMDLSLLPVRACVYDIIYNPLETALLLQAKARGNKAAGGLGMLLHQAVPAFAAWFGVTPQVDKELETYMKAQL